MAHFYGTTQGHKQVATRTGSKQSGITSTANSYTIGTEVTVSYNPSLERDVVYISITSGSHTLAKRLASFYYDDEGTLCTLENNFPELLV